MPNSSDYKKSGKKKTAKKAAPKRGRKAFQPSEEQRIEVQDLSRHGTPQKQIASIIGIAIDTLKKHFREELDNGKEAANAAVAGSLYRNAIAGCVTSQIFWLKCQAGWSEKGPREEDTGPPIINIIFDDAENDPALQEMHNEAE